MSKSKRERLGLPPKPWPEKSGDLIEGEALYVEVRTPIGELESVSVFIPIATARARNKEPHWTPSPKKSFCGELEGWFASGKLYLALNNRKSGFYTGVPLPGEKIDRMSEEAALLRARVVYEEGRKDGK